MTWSPTVSSFWRVARDHTAGCFVRPAPSSGSGSGSVRLRVGALGPRPGRVGCLQRLAHRVLHVAVAGHHPRERSGEGRGRVVVVRRVVGTRHVGRWRRRLARGPREAGRRDTGPGAHLRRGGPGRCGQGAALLPGGRRGRHAQEAGELVDALVVGGPGPGSRAPSAATGDDAGRTAAGRGGRAARAGGLGGPRGGAVARRSGARPGRRGRGQRRAERRQAPGVGVLGQRTRGPCGGGHGQARDAERVGCHLGDVALGREEPEHPAPSGRDGPRRRGRPGRTARARPRWRRRGSQPQRIATAPLTTPSDSICAVRETSA